MTTKRNNHLQLVTDNKEEGDSPMTGNSAPAVPTPPPAPTHLPTGELSEADYIRRKRNEEKLRLDNNRSTIRKYRLQPGDSKPRHR